MNEVAILYQDEKFRKYLDAKVIADTKNMTQEEWLKSRQAGIGGSDSSAIAGLNPWKSSIQLYMEKKEENPQEIKHYEWS
ncbi:yqaJ-like viral recombinase domain protein [[Clostridium] sordellii ATCC 9714]|nr:yqaJ-like viral recombinase domain protein [[Clostridium] sordellii ATCC 9714] [Paeniclostridium sordellii ATCC 9714]